MTYFHPKDLMEIYQVGTTKSKSHLDHLTYQLNYFIEAKYEKEKGKDNNNKKLKFITDKHEITLNPASVQMMEQVLDFRIRQMAYLSQHQIVRIYEGQLISHLVHGLGSGHVTETAMTIHPVYGVPYIPASSIKGIVRHWFVQTFLTGSEKVLEDEVERSQKEEQLHAVYEDVFGSQKQRGKVSFFDVYIPSGTLIPDVMTVHYKNYYNNKGKNPASDNDSPIPILFYSVKSDERIQFPFIVQTRRETNSGFTHDELAEIVSDWLKNAMSEMGIGSKTSSGYGRFSDWKDVTEDKIIKLQHIIKQEQEEWIQSQQEKVAKEKEAALLESMTEEEKLVYQISQLDPNNEQDRLASKDQFFNTVMESKNVKAAEALKNYWKQTNDWKEKAKPKKRQEIKVVQVKQLLNEI